MDALEVHFGLEPDVPPVFPAMSPSETAIEDMWAGSFGRRVNKTLKAICFRHSAARPLTSSIPLTACNCPAHLGIRSLLRACPPIGQGALVRFGRGQLFWTRNQRKRCFRGPPRYGTCLRARVVDWATFRTAFRREAASADTSRVTPSASCDMERKADRRAAQHRVVGVRLPVGSNGYVRTVPTPRPNLRRPHQVESCVVPSLEPYLLATHPHGLHSILRQAM